MGADEEYLDNLLKSVSEGSTETESDLDILLSRLDQELDYQLQQQDASAEPELDGLNDFGAEPELDGLNDFGTEAELDELSGFGAESELDGLDALFGEVPAEEMGASGLSEDDIELAEINDLLRKSDNNELVDDDMLALLESMSEEEPALNEESSAEDEFDFFGMDYAQEPVALSETDTVEDSIQEESAKVEKKPKEKKIKEKKVKEKKVKEKKAGGLFAKKAKAEEQNAEETDAADVPEKKEKGFLAKFFDAITEEVEEEEGKAKDENQEILDELDREDAANGKKKKKEKKPKKEKKEKEKKPKKEKAPKEKKTKEKTPKEEKTAKNKKKKLPTGMLLAVVVFAGTLLFVLLVFIMLIPNISNKRAAVEAFAKKEYENVYYALAGEELNENEQKMFYQAKLLMQLERKADSYENYSAMGMEEEALNALIKGVQKYQELKPYAEEYGIMASLDETYTYILDMLSQNYGITEADALELLTVEDVESYVQKLKELIGNE